MSLPLIAVSSTEGLFSKKKPKPNSAEAAEAAKKEEAKAADAAKNVEKIKGYLKEDGLILKVLSETTRDNFELVAIAVKSNPMAYQFATEKLRGGKKGEELADVLYESLNNIKYKQPTKEIMNIFEFVPKKIRKFDTPSRRKYDDAKADLLAYVNDVPQGGRRN